MKNKDKPYHECEYYFGKIDDVVVRDADKLIRCRRCNEILREHEIDPRMLYRIQKEKMKNKKNRKKK